MCKSSAGGRLYYLCLFNEGIDNCDIYLWSYRPATTDGHFIYPTEQIIVFWLQYYVKEMAILQELKFYSKTFTSFIFLNKKLQVVDFESILKRQSRNFM